MNSETYQELFHYVSFPVFAVSAKGMLIYKNLACAKYLPEIYGSRSVKSKISPEFPRESGLVHVLGGSAYSTALAFMDGEKIVFLSFSRLQCMDGKSIANKILNVWGSTLSEFLVGFKRTVALKKYDLLDSYFADEKLLLFAKEISGFWGRDAYSPAAVLEPVFQKLNKSFEMIGYDFSAEIEKNFPKYLPIQIPITDFLFLIGKLLYLTMKFSCTRHVNLVLFSEIAYSRHTLQLKTKTNLKELPQVQGNSALLLEELLPECAAEIDLLNRIGLIKNPDFSIRIDALEMLTVTCHFPYEKPAWNVVCSVDYFSLPISGYIENMLHSVLAKFKDTDASC